MAPRESTSRASARSISALAEFHGLADHAGPADGCQECAAQRQRQTATALRTRQRQVRQRVDATLGKAVSA